MLCTKFNWPVGSEGGFLKVFNIYGPGSHSVHVIRNILTNCHPIIACRLHMKFGFKKRLIVFLGKKV